MVSRLLFLELGYVVVQLFTLAIPPSLSVVSCKRTCSRNWCWCVCDQIVRVRTFKKITEDNSQTQGTALGLGVTSQVVKSDMGSSLTIYLGAQMIMSLLSFV